MAGTRCEARVDLYQDFHFLLTSRFSCRVAAPRRVAHKYQIPSKKSRMGYISLLRFALTNDVHAQSQKRVTKLYTYAYHMELVPPLFS